MKNYLIVLFCLLLSTPLQAQDRITLLLDWFINPDHGPIIIAQEKGYFADAGLEVEVIAPADPADPPKMVAAGKADLAVSYQPQLHLQVAEGMPLVRVGTFLALKWQKQGGSGRYEQAAQGVTLWWTEPAGGSGRPMVFPEV